jgi:hypothetical protein
MCWFCQRSAPLGIVTGFILLCLSGSGVAAVVSESTPLYQLPPILAPPSTGKEKDLLHDSSALELILLVRKPGRSRKIRLSSFPVGQTDQAVVGLLCYERTWHNRMSLRFCRKTAGIVRVLLDLSPPINFLFKLSSLNLTRLSLSAERKA